MMKILRAKRTRMIYGECHHCGKSTYDNVHEGETFPTKISTDVWGAKFYEINNVHGDKLRVYLDDDDFEIVEGEDNNAK